MTPFEQLSKLVTETKKPVFCKLLARNDHIWADRKLEERGKGKQNGFYVPAEIRTSGFFPEQKQREDKPHIYDVKVKTNWPQQAKTGTFTSNFVHYSNKGPESHFTGLPKDLFSNLPPYSLLVISQPDDRSSERACWTGVVIPSGTQEYDDAFDLLDLPPSFLFGLQDISNDRDDEDLVELIYKALLDGNLNDFILNSSLDTGKEAAFQTQENYLNIANIPSFDAFTYLRRPGDVILDLCDLQYERFKKVEIRLRAAQMIKIIDEAKPKIQTVRDTIQAVVSGFPEFLELFKSLRGARAARMGKAFELHIERVFLDSSVSFCAQAKIGNRTPDFLLPSLAAYLRDPESTTILTAKSTLRERWQQILNEGIGARLFLATLDRSITDQTIKDMENAGIFLVVPEKFVDPASNGLPVGVYRKKENVISFSQFFELHARQYRK